jgi:hypothetical protein
MSPDAAVRVSGQTLIVNGGATIRRAVSITPETLDRVTHGQDR